MNFKRYCISLITVGCLILSGCQSNPSASSTENHQFTIAVIPDTQNMVDYTRQKSEGFALDGADMFIEHMRYIADNTQANGGDITFVTSVGDVWQHTTDDRVESAHYSRGLRALKQSTQRNMAEIAERTRQFELPLAMRGYDILADTGIVFSVVPGNHDYDNGWKDSHFNPNYDRIEELKGSGGNIVRYDPDILGMLHIGGLNNFNSVFGNQSKYFKDKKWYVGSFNGGANSAQIFHAGGYKFLHIGLEMQAGDKVLAWAQSMISKYPGLPTILSTHDFLNTHNQRLPNPILDLVMADPSAHNSAEDIWQNFISTNDQIFLVLSGHHHGQGYRKDKNKAGNEVYQILSDFQGRGQSASPEKGAPVVGIGDGWLRLMKFDTGIDVPTIKVRTYSTHYKKLSVEQPNYALWYKNQEQPHMSNSEFMKVDHFSISLIDFKKRFGDPTSSVD